MLKEVLSQASLKATGFESADETNTVKALQNPNYGSATKLYDAMIASNVKILKSLHVLKQFDSLDKFKFVHIVITDGSDNSSENKIGDAIHLMSKVGEIPILQTHLIDVEADSKELRQIAQEGGKNCHYHYGKSSDIKDIFQKITMGIQLQQRTRALHIQGEDVNMVVMRKQVDPQIYLKVNRYCVLLTVDTSYSMKGARYNQLLSAVQNLQDQLGKDDYIACIRFDQKVQEVDITN